MFFNARALLLFGLVATGYAAPTAFEERDLVHLVARAKVPANGVKCGTEIFTEQAIKDWVFEARGQINTTPRPAEPHPYKNNDVPKVFPKLPANNANLQEYPITNSATWTGVDYPGKYRVVTNNAGVYAGVMYHHTGGNAFKACDPIETAPACAAPGVTTRSLEVVRDLWERATKGKSKAKAKAPACKKPATKPKAKTPKAKTPKAKTPKAKTPKAKTPKAKTPKAKTPKAKNLPLNQRLRSLRRSLLRNPLRSPLRSLRRAERAGVCLRKPRIAFIKFETVL